MIDKKELSLIEKSKSGNTKAFNKLVQKYYKRIYYIVFRYLKSEQAEDITQNTFLDAWKYIESFEGKSSFYTWLVRIAINNSKKQFNWDAKHSHDNIEDLNIASKEIDPTDTLQDINNLELLKEAIETLTDKQKLILHLRAKDGLSFIEIGQTIGCSESTAKSHYHHIKNKLVKHIKGE